ncbi:lipopolysaccharide biosynthesis regulator YciM [Halorubrum alkaliphilum]|uniref:Lipopolysaccharide biosynthesis regulator YciM n=1 Tax=Halorubrum alkaliphilum TaxID=261290 RepID=A0A8T4GGU0_9EURY|nr:lipopolysaccharide biosynthesis regulator YciM [Halorubrum alkaliphilum]
MRPLAVALACGPNVQAVVRSLTPPMLSKQFIQQIVRLKPSSTTHHECRQCGYSVEKEVDECPQCGSHEIAAYDLE